MSDTPQGPGWWLASDGKFYPPESAPGGAAAPGDPAPGSSPSGGYQAGGYPSVGYPSPGGYPSGGYPAPGGSPYAVPYGAMPAAAPKWYENVAVVVIALFCCWPVGLAFVWMNTSWTTQTKWIITAVTAALVVVGGAFNVAVTSSSP
jgi:hypothetical protein